MISEETSKDKTIDSLIRQGRSFAIYRIPGEETPRFVMQASGSARLFYDIEDLNERELTQYQDFCRHMFSEKARSNENHVCHF